MKQMSNYRVKWGEISAWLAGTHTAVFAGPNRETVDNLDALSSPLEANRSSCLLTFHENGSASSCLSAIRHDGGPEIAQ